MFNDFNTGQQSGPSEDGQIRGAVYTRFSSDAQRKASTEDQIRNCREAAERRGWIVREDCLFSDEEKTGTTVTGRNGLQSLVAMAKTKPRPFEYVLIDDTSRLGRNVPDVFKTVDILNHRGIHLYFVSDGLNSKDEWFRDMFLLRARGDEQYSKQLGQKTKRGRRGRFLAGFNPGGGCYGYLNIPVPDLTRKANPTNPSLLGVKQVVEPEQAAIVVQIFQAYADGQSYLSIAKMLNDRGISPSQSPRKKSQASWSKHAIQEMLANERYIGKLTWGTSEEVRDPETGKKERRPIPEEQWDRREDPELRIIPDELWATVQEVRIQKSGKMGVQRTGGMNRTAQSRKYLFSGLLKCGLCGEYMTITGTNPARYGCSTRRNRDACEHRSTIRQDDLERTFLGALGDQLRILGLREELTQSLHQHIQALSDQRVIDEEAGAEKRKGLEESLRMLMRNQENILLAIREGCGSRALYEDLTKIEGRIDRVNELLAPATKAPERPIKIDEVREFVNAEASRFEDLLMGSPEKLKLEFQRRISKIILTPFVDDRGPVYKVTGDVGLFSAPEDVLQTNQGDLIGLQYTIPIDFELVPYKVRLKWSFERAA